MEHIIKENTQKTNRPHSFCTKKEGLFCRLIEACGGKCYVFPLAVLFASGILAGALLAHMSVKAEATTSPYLFSGNIIRMPINTSRVTGEQSSLNSLRSNNLQSNESLAFKERTIHQKIQYTFMNSQNSIPTEHQEPSSQGLLSFGNGVVSILTEEGTAPVRLTPSSSVLLPPFVLSHSNSDVSPAYTNKKLFSNNEKLSLANASSLLFSHCAIQPETKRDGSQRFVQTLESTAISTGTAMRSAKYRSVVDRYASKYRIDPELILGIIMTESNFNPYAVSQSQALGLMQIVPTTAGEEVHTYLTGQNGRPSPELLFEPEKNIQYGTIYLHLLNTRYFQDVSNVASRKLLMIAAYNGGPGAVLRVFSQDNEKAISIVNNMTPELVYQELTKKMPRIESRLYVDRVLNSMQSFVRS